MKVKFYKDDFNARFTWSWGEGFYITEDEAEIENFKGLGLRCEEVEEVAEEVAPVKRTRKPRK